MSIFCRERGDSFFRKFVKCSSALLVVAVCVPFFAACQPTPLGEIVVNKGDEAIEEIVRQTASEGLTDVSSSESLSGTEGTSQESVQEPEERIWSDVLELRNLTISVVADIVYDPDEKYSVFEIAPRGITQQELEKAVDIWMQGETLYEVGEKTRAAIEKEILEIKEEIYRKETSENPDSFMMSYYVEEEKKTYEIYDYLEYLEQLYHRTPKDIEMKVAEVSLDEFGGFEAVGDLGRETMASVDVFCNESKKFSGLVLYNAMEFAQFESRESSENKEISGLRLEDAKQVSADFVSELLDFEVKMKNVDIVTKTDDKTKQCYAFSYTRKYIGASSSSFVKFEYTFGEHSDTLGGVYTELWNQEEIEVWVDSSGIIYFEWGFPEEEIELVNDNTAVLDFEEVQEIVRKQMEFKYSSIPSIKEMTVTRVEMGMMRVRSGESQKYFVIPVWDVFGDVTEYNVTRTDVFQYENGVLLTINAIDGSVINRTLMY